MPVSLAVTDAEHLLGILTGGTWATFYRTTI